MVNKVADALGHGWRWAGRRFRLLVGIALLVGLILGVEANREAIARFDWSIDPLALGGAVGLLAVAPLAQALTLRLALRRSGARPAAVGLLRVWARSFLLRYEPSGAVGFVYRVRERERLGATRPQVLTATGYEQLAAVTAGALVALAALVLAGGTPPALACGLAAGFGALALALRPAFLGDRLARRLARRGIAVAGPLPGRTLAAMVAVNVGGWTATGLGASVLAGALLGPARVPGALTLLGTFALAWVVGVLVPLLPGGLGPRDAALAVGLAPAIGPGRAAVLALALRVVSLAGELLAAGLAESAALILARRGRTARAAPAAVAAPALPQALAPVPAPSPRTVVVVPTYDERDALPLFVARFEAAAPGFDLLVVDDASPDGTGRLADALAAERPWMHVLHRTGKDGLGMAYRAGFGWCLERGYEVIGQMDCDLSHPPEKLAEMRRVLLERDAGLVLGSRYIQGGGTDGWSATRLALSRIGCRASRLVLGLPFSDLSGGFKMWRAGCLGGLGLEEMLSAGYAFQVEATQLAHLSGARIEEVPFVFSERVAGASKMSLGISLEGIRVTLALRRHRCRR
ncbi:MAG TPA: polyprenol monophosphomannose synthase, partial [Solirubrobacteraceae bacterium]|nr:polyprenol monophosphomannose synthase [Solirubrobacteraceae bacterium]